MLPKKERTEEAKGHKVSLHELCVSLMSELVSYVPGG